MIGRQVNFYLTADDRLQLLKSIGERVSFVLLQRSDAHPYRPCEHLGSGEDFWAIAYLCPPVQAPDVLDSILSGAADSSELLAIEFIQPAATDSIVNRGRFWYTPKRLFEGKFVPKPKEFVDWANAVLACVKRELFPLGNGDWIGSEARSRLSAGEIRLLD